jgi:hypothetical protein
MICATRPHPPIGIPSFAGIMPLTNQAMPHAGRKVIRTARGIDSSRQPPAADAKQQTDARKLEQTE